MLLCPYVYRYFCDPSVLLADHALSEQQHGNTDFCTEVILQSCAQPKSILLLFPYRSQKVMEKIQGSSQMLRKTKKTAIHVECATKLSAVFLTWNNTCGFTLVKNLSLVQPVEKLSMIGQPWGITQSCTQMRGPISVMSAIRNLEDQTLWSITKLLMTRTTGPLSVHIVLRASKTRRTCGAMRKLCTVWRFQVELVNSMCVQIAVHTATLQLVWNIIERWGNPQEQSSVLNECLLIF